MPALRNNPVRLGGSHRPMALLRPTHLARLGSWLLFYLDFFEVLGKSQQVNEELEHLLI